MDFGCFEDFSIDMELDWTTLIIVVDKRGKNERYI